MVQILRILGADLDRTETWIRYDKALCLDCVSSCCTLPVEARLSDLIRMELVDEFEKGEPAKDIAKRLKKEGVIERYNAKSGLFTLTRLANNDCLYLHRKTRLCTIYDKRPDTCRNHPRVGPRPNYCAYKPQSVR